MSKKSYYITKDITGEYTNYILWHGCPRFNKVHKYFTSGNNCVYLCLLKPRIFDLSNIETNSRIKITEVRLQPKAIISKSDRARYRIVRESIVSNYCSLELEQHTDKSCHMRTREKPHPVSVIKLHYNG